MYSLNKMMNHYKKYLTDNKGLDPLNPGIKLEIK